MISKLEALVSSGALLLWEPSLRGDPVRRTLLITPEVDDCMDRSAWADDSVGLRYSQLRADFDRFVDGSRIPVGMDPYAKDDSAFLARLDPVEYGIWSIRSVAPRPALRVFGAFCERDVFLALRVEERAVLGGRGSRAWANARENAIVRWNSLLPGEFPLLGSDVNDFISEKASSV